MIDGNAKLGQPEHPCFPDVAGANRKGTGDSPARQGQQHTALYPQKLRCRVGGYERLGSFIRFSHISPPAFPEQHVTGRAGSAFLPIGCDRALAKIDNLETGDGTVVGG